MRIFPFLFAVVVLAAAVGCDSAYVTASATNTDTTGRTTGDTTSTSHPPPREIMLRLTTDSTYVYTSCTRGGLYCFNTVPDSGTMTARLTLGTPTSNHSAPICCLGTIVSADSGVTFADSLTGGEFVDTDSVVTVFVGPVAWLGYYDYFTFTGKMTNGQYAGRWRQQVDEHARYNLGSFVTVP